SPPGPRAGTPGRRSPSPLRRDAGTSPTPRRTARATRRSPAGTSTGPTIEVPRRRATTPAGPRSSSRTGCRAPSDPGWPRRDSSTRRRRSLSYGRASTSAASGPGCTSARWSLRPSRHLLHLLEHLRERRLHRQGLLDLVAREVRVLRVLQEAVALVVANELDERLRVRLPVVRKTLEVLERGVQPRLSEQHDGVFGVLVEVRVEDPLVHEPRVVVEEDPAQVVEFEGSEVVGICLERLPHRFAVGAHRVGPARL